MSLPRRLVSLGAIVLAHAFVPAVRTVRDPTSGFFICRRQVVEGAELRPVGFKILLEILARGKYGQIREVPYVVEHRQAGSSKLGVSEQLDYLGIFGRLDDRKLRGDRRLELPAGSS